MWLLTRKKLFFTLSLFCLFFQPVFSQEVYLTDNEFRELMSIIRTSRANSEEQKNLIMSLKHTLAAQEARLLQSLNTLELSEAELSRALNILELSRMELTELRNSLSRIRTYSDELNEYCLRLEQENKSLKSKNKGLKIGIGASSGIAGILLIALLILFI